jgi:hypothetical protein
MNKNCSQDSLDQLVRSPPCHGGGYGFKSRTNRNASLAQMVEQQTFNLRVVGSIPTRGTNARIFAGVIYLIRGVKKNPWNLLTFVSGIRYNSAIQRKG